MDVRPLAGSRSSPLPRSLPQPCGLGVSWSEPRTGLGREGRTCRTRRPSTRSPWRERGRAHTDARPIAALAVVLPGLLLPWPLRDPPTRSAGHSGRRSGRGSSKHPTRLRAERVRCRPGREPLGDGHSGTPVGAIWSSPGWPSRAGTNDRIVRFVLASRVPPSGVRSHHRNAAARAGSTPSRAVEGDRPTASTAESPPPIVRTNIIRSFATRLHGVIG